MAHLANYLPPSEAETLAALALQFVSGHAEGMQERDDAVFEYDPLSRVEPIEHESRDGFWSWNNGGYEVCLPASIYSAWGRSLCPAPILPAIRSGIQFIAEEWNEQHLERPPFETCVTACEGEPGHEWQEAAYEWEQEWWQPNDDCYYWKARAVFYAPGSPNNESGEPEVYLDAYLCADSYGRDIIPWLSCYPGGEADQTSGGFKLTLPVAKFIKLRPDQIDRMVKVALRKLAAFVNCG